VFSQADVVASFDRSTRERGAAYLRTLHIRQLDIDHEQSRVVAVVQGSHPKPYDVTLNVAASERPGAKLRSICTCPVTLNCKHGAAAALGALESFAPQPAWSPVAALRRDDRDAADGAVDSWIERIGSFANDRPPKSGNRVHYILSVREIYFVPRVTIEAIVGATSRDGTLGKTRRVDAASLAHLPGAHVTTVDRTIGRLIGGSSVARSALQPPSPAILATILDLAIETGRLHWESASNPPLVRAPIEAAGLAWRIDDDDGRLRLTLQGRTHATLIPARPLWYVDAEAGSAGPAEVALDPELAAILVASPALTERQAQRAQIAWRRAVPLAIAPAPPLQTPSQFVDAEPVPWLRVDSGEFPFARLDFAYGNVRVSARDAVEEVLVSDGAKRGIWPRRRDVEEAAQGRLADAGLMLVGWPWVHQDDRMRDAYRFGANEDERWARFLHTEIPRLRADGWQIEIADDFPFSVVAAGDDWDADVVATDNRWFEVDLGISVEGERISLLPIIVEALRSRDFHANSTEPGAAEPVYARLPGRGTFVALPAERIDRLLGLLVELFDDHPLTQDGRLKLPPARAGILTGIEQFAGSTRWIDAGAVRDLVRALELATARPVALDASFHGELRAYQQRGVAWLQALREHGFGGVLADDMGLGKTVQLLAHASVERAAGRLVNPILVVAPTSVVPNWRAESERFVPDLRVVCLTGPDRARHFDEISGADLVLTTYALLQRDSAVLLEREWSLVVLDEAQAIKNPRSKGAQVAVRLRAGQRLALSGTPVENHLDELWSIFAFALPELLGDRAGFTRAFRTPIEKRNDVMRRDALALRVRPFLLRRTKEAVESDLPPKTEIVQRVELDGAQRDLYETIRLTMHQRVRDEIARRGIDRSRIVVLDALLKLRQVCCDPRLLAMPAARATNESAKLDALLDMLPDLLDDGRRILLFSQFTSMLDLIKPELERLNMPFLELRGSTRDRITPVERFQAGEVPLFLISLKAGGTGLNLTAADTVIHYDPWWNPAVERQATDRAHRIGQDKPVFVYKLITIGTVEERIVEMQARKAELAERILGESTTGGAPIDVDEIDRLFAPLSS
jgi:superfamily II DNA or RNA helicase